MPSEPLSVHTAAPLIELDHASVLRDGRLALDALTLVLPQARHVAILGPNGCGKSTLIQLLTRELHPLAREDGRPAVRILGQSQWDVRAIRSRLGVVSAAQHEVLRSLPSLRVEQAVIGAFDARIAVDEDAPADAARQDAVDAALVRADAAHLAGRRYAALSTGEARRVLLARALVHAPQALVLDEPTTGLDVAARHRLLATLRRLARDGVTLLLVTHHAEELIPEVGHVVLMREGRIVAEGPREEMLVPHWLERAFGTPLWLRDGDPPVFVVGEPT